jgi:hypothetical protein
MKRKLNGFHQFLVYIDIFKLCVTKISSINSRNKRIKAILYVNMDHDLEVATEIIRYVFQCQQWNPEQNHNIKIGNQSLKYEQIQTLGNKSNKAKLRS